MNIITALFNNAHEAKIDERDAPFQYDYGQILRFVGLDLPSTFEVHFSNDIFGESKTGIGTDGDVVIPDEYLTTGDYIYAWVYLHTGADDGETEYVVTIPVNPRARPTDQEPTPIQQDVITQTIAALNVAVTQAGESAEAAEQSATEAAASAESATESVTLSESWAVGGTGTRPGEDTDNAKHYAELAQQGAEEAGFAWFDIDDSTGLMMVTVTDNLAEDVTFAINEQSGELEVIVI